MCAPFHGESLPGRGVSSDLHRGFLLTLLPPSWARRKGGGGGGEEGGYVSDDGHSLFDSMFVKVTSVRELRPPSQAYTVSKYVCMCVRV